MGKILKYCSKCDEGFAEKFGFCPNCGATLQAFEMNPLAAASADESSPSVEREVAPPAPAFIEPDEAPVLETSAPEADVVEKDEPARADEIIDEPVVEETRVAAATEAFYQPKPIYVDEKPVSLEAEHAKAAAAGGYYLTVIEEKNVKQRNGLLLGTAGLMLVALMSSMVYNIFSKDLDIASINNDIFNAVIVDDIPMATEDEVQQKKDKDAGGGGGGGRKEEETTLGDLANQSKNPQRPPQAIPRLTNPSLVLPPASTQGNKTFEQKYDRFGDPNGRFSSWNNGPGSGGGQGTGTGTGQGSGRGTGAGSGIGSGYGGGLGSGSGNGTGSGNQGDGEDIPRARGESSAIKILSKPRPGYTDAARQNNVQGTVILRVTFLASGQVGSVSAVKGLPNGLTEMAIAAAKRISFTPAKNNGVPQSVTRQIEYTFSIY